MEHLLNLKDYSVTEHVFFATGCILWVIAYLAVIFKIRTKQFIEIPIIAVCANFTWEIIWSFIFNTDMGLIYVWGYRLWFFLDCYIVYGLFKYGMKQVDIEPIKQHYGKILVGIMIGLFIIQYYFIALYDVPTTRMGALSGYAINIIMSACYITLILRMKSVEGFSYLAGWCKGLGTFLIAIFCFMHFTDLFLLNLCVMTAILDGIYVAILTKRLRAEKSLQKGVMAVA
jgi:hypothetical protein